MSRTFQILSIAHTGGPNAPGEFVIAGDFTQVFRGKFYRQHPAPTWPTVPAVQEFYTSSTVPAGYRLIAATTFEVIDNPSYAGRYTVFTQLSAIGLQSSSFGSSETTIRVIEQVPAPAMPSHATIGTIVNVSTYLIEVAGEAALAIPPGTSFDSRRLSLFGKNSSGWGEGYAQNFVDLLQNFASSTSPVNPFVGQFWFDTTTELVFVYDGSSWITVNGTAFAPATSFKHVQTSASNTWTITHNLGAAAPFIVLIQFFRDVGGQAKMILPSDISFVDSNTVTCSFSNPETGWALVRL